MNMKRAPDSTPAPGNPQPQPNSESRGLGEEGLDPQPQFFSRIKEILTTKWSDVHKVLQVH